MLPVLSLVMTTQDLPAQQLLTCSRNFGAQQYGPPTLKISSKPVRILITCGFRCSPSSLRSPFPRPSRTLSSTCDGNQDKSLVFDPCRSEPDRLDDCSECRFQHPRARLRTVSREGCQLTHAPESSPLAGAREPLFEMSELV